MVKVEGIYRGGERIGQELLLNERGFELIVGNGNKNKFFDSIDEDIDFSLFLHHIRWAREMNLRGFIFVNIKPTTLIKYRKEIREIVKGKVVIELREDFVRGELFGEIVNFRKEFPFLLSLDDFGRGSSNLDRVAMLLPNFIKLDMSLVKSVKDLANLVHFLRNFAKGSLFIAEKVEDEKVYRTARSVGIELWQGWYERKLFGSSS